MEKLAFFGTSNRSLPILRTLAKSFDLALCVTKADQKVGRHQKNTPTQVKTWAIQNSVPYVELTELKKTGSALLSERLLGESVKLGVVADFSFIIPNSILSTLAYGMINIHFSLLPKYRGASPVQHAILNGDTLTGITYMLTDEGMDTGDIIKQIPYHLAPTETADEAYANLFELAAQELPAVITGFLTGTLVPQKQEASAATYTYSKTHPNHTFIYKADAKLDWAESLDLIERQIRAYYAWPCAWTTFEDLRNAKLTFTSNGISKGSEHAWLLKPDPKLDRLRIKLIKAHLTNQTLAVDKLQIEGKAPSTWVDFLNGYARL